MSVQRFDRNPNTGGWTVTRDGYTHWMEKDSLKDALKDEFSLYAWPGGYPIKYIADECTELCGECAAKAFMEGATRIPGRIIGPDIPSAVVEEADRDLMCEECNRLILAQNLCPDHGYQPDAITNDDEPFAYRCPICHPECFPNEEGA